MKTIGSTDRTWSLSQAIEDQIQKESWQEWGQQPAAQITYDYRPLKLQLTEAAKAGLAGSIHFIKSLPKL